ncbi:MAG: hypothetical protein AB7K52_13160 [Phycisphaerales bacterium]
MNLQRFFVGFSASIGAIAPVTLDAQAAGDGVRTMLPQESLVFRFEPDAKNSGMSGWRPAHSGTPSPQRWGVRETQNAPAGPRALVAESPSGEGNAFNLCVLENARAADVSVSAWLRALAGEDDQGGGLAWRIQSLDGAAADDYYCARWNPLEGNFRVYVVARGVRRQLASANVQADPNSWHAISISHVGTKIEALFDGGARLTVDDATFTQAGLAGVWTKADASTAFDDVSISDATPVPTTMLETLRRDARRIEPLVTSDTARRFLGAALSLPTVPKRTIYYDRTSRSAISKDEAEALPPDRREKVREIVVDETYYYTTRYGSPLAYARAIDLAAGRGLKIDRGTRVLDFGYGTIGHLRLLASLGASCAGVEIDPTLEHVYAAPGDTGPIGSAGGRIDLITGSWPGDARVRAAAGDGLDLFLSKNTLKRGYVHPERQVDERMLVKLGVSDEEFVAAVVESLKPGGLMVIYNICPAPAPPDQPYKPWADGRCPFPREMLEAAGLEVLAYDEVDDEACRRQGRALGWHLGDRPMDLEADLFAWYTIARKR